MRRFFAALLCLLLMGAMIVPASAAGGSMSISSSASTVYRGDTFTLSVYLSGSGEIGYGGFVLSYDSSAFEVVGGSCTASGAALADYSTSRGGGTFLFEPAKSYSGGIFTITLRVKGDAAFRSYSFSGTGSIDGGGCGVSGTGVNVVCSHSYGSYSKADDSTHTRTCTICSQVETTDHTWDSGKVTKPATCKEAGSKLLTCTACQHTKTEVVEKTSDHSYGGWTKVNDSTHKGTCSVCGVQTTGSHSWNSGKVTKKATCTATGTMVRTCSVCGATRTETVSKLAHDYTDWTKVDAATHTRKCESCGKEETEGHDYGAQWDHGDEGHYHSCDDCGDQIDQQQHTPGPEPTDDDPQTCTVCGRILKPSLRHEHVYVEAWTAKEEGHWHNCEHCNEKGSYAEHEYDDNCDATCNVCNWKREAPHDPQEEWSADASGHWHVCGTCQKKLAVTEHTPGPEASISAAQYCTVCGFEIAPRIEHPHKYDTMVAQHWHVCICGETTAISAEDNCQICNGNFWKKLGDFPWWILCILEALAIGGLLYFFLVYQKKPKMTQAEAAEAQAEVETAEEPAEEKEPVAP